MAADDWLRAYPSPGGCRSPETISALRATGPTVGREDIKPDRAADRENSRRKEGALATTSPMASACVQPDARRTVHEGGSLAESPSRRQPDLVWEEHGSSFPSVGDSGGTRAPSGRCVGSLHDERASRVHRFASPEGAAAWVAGGTSSSFPVSRAVTIGTRERRRKRSTLRRGRRPIHGGPPGRGTVSAPSCRRSSTTSIWNRNGNVRREADAAWEEAAVRAYLGRLLPGGAAPVNSCSGSRGR